MNYTLNKKKKMKNKTIKKKPIFYTIIFGTRPEYLKMKPLIDFFHNKKVNFQVIYIKQHNNITGLKLPVKYKLIDIKDTTNNRMEDIGSQILEYLPKYLVKTSHIFVQGDTATAYYSAIVGFQKKIKVVHIEAGLRTYNIDKPFPEEGYRQMISRVASYNFTPHEDSSELLRHEKVSGKIYTVGNTIIDLIKSYKLKVKLGNTVLITFHRRENWDNITTCIKEINKLTDKYDNLKFIWFLHPNKDIQKIIKKYISPKVVLREPLEHYEFTQEIASCYVLLTDSGGIQEEASYLGKQCIVLRTSTERSHIGKPYIETIKSFEGISSIFDKLSKKVLRPSYAYGKGNSCELIYKILKKEIKNTYQDGGGITRELSGDSKEHLDIIFEWIKNDKKFGIIRPGDGEYAIISNLNIKVNNGWEYKKDGILKNDLINAFNKKLDNLYIGISCNYCINGKEIQEYYRKNFNIPNERITYANIFCNANYKLFIDFIKSYNNKNIYYVGSGTKETNDIKIKDRFIISESLVNNWDDLHISETNRLFNWISNINDSIICISAGPITKTWIPQLLEKYPNNIYLDVGSSFDAFLKNNPNLRPYQIDPNSGDANKVCNFNI